MISLGIFFIFSKFWISGLLGGGGGVQYPQQFFSFFQNSDFSGFYRGVCGGGGQGGCKGQKNDP